MYQTIGERIEVAGVFNAKGFTPKRFKWQERLYPITEITLVNTIKDGGVKKRYYSVCSGINVYRLVFNREDESWLLAEVWCEG